MATCTSEPPSGLSPGPPSSCRSPRSRTFTNQSAGRIDPRTASTCSALRRPHPRRWRTRRRTAHEAAHAAPNRPQLRPPASHVSSIDGTRRTRSWRPFPSPLRALMEPRAPATTAPLLNSACRSHKISPLEPEGPAWPAPAHPRRAPHEPPRAHPRPTPSISPEPLLGLSPGSSQRGPPATVCGLPVGRRAGADAPRGGP